MKNNVCTLAASGEHQSTSVAGGNNSSVVLSGHMPQARDSSSSKEIRPGFSEGVSCCKKAVVADEVDDAERAAEVLVSLGKQNPNLQNQGDVSVSNEVIIGIY